ncbi:MAG: hypothetical protein MUO60_01420, partial [Clostridiaceae bacterium]|nr:hypothetical protein [Clostridiaceae bacterium]
MDSGIVKITIGSSGKFEVVNKTNVLVEIPSDIFAKKVNIITISSPTSTYLMNLLSDKNKYQSVIPMPAVKGDFELKIL